VAGASRSAAPAGREIALEVGERRHSGGRKAGGQAVVVALGEPCLQERAGGQAGELLPRVGIERARLDIGARRCGDVCGGDVGLLGSAWQGGSPL
jgi:hypothetical protein